MARVTVVSVTYGMRWSLLSRVLAAAKAQGAAEAVVVDNGAQQDITTLAAEAFGPWVRVVRMSHNTGSAAGVGAGITVAVDGGAEHILVLDDDNLPLDGCLAALTAAYEDLSAKTRPCAVFAFRSHHGGPAIAAAAAGRGVRIRNTFCGFHVADLPRKLLGKRPVTPVTLPESVSLQRAAYGGLYFGADLVADIGLPNADFVLYQDDYDFTYRIVRHGGEIRAITMAVIEDIDDSWTVAGSGGHALDNWVDSTADMRVFYTFRNSVYWDIHGRGDRNLVYFTNLVVYSGLLLVVCIRKRRWDRLRLLYKALVDGVRGRLGEHPDFRLVGR